MISTHIERLIRVYWLHIASVVSIVLNLWLLTRPAPTPTVTTKTEYIDRIVEKEVVKVVNNDIVKYKDRVITRTITKPGGTQIVEQIKELAGEHDKSTGVARAEVVDKTTKRTESVVQVGAPPRYLLALSSTPDWSNASVGIGMRVHTQLPIYLGAGVSKAGTIYGLSLNVGVLF